MEPKFQVTPINPTTPSTSINPPNNFMGGFSNKILKWLMLLALVLIIVSFVSFWFGGSSFTESGVTLEINGPAQASVGDEVVYIIKYANETKLALRDVRFKFSYPDDSVVLRDGNVSEDLSELFNFDELAVGASGEREFRAFLVGDKGNIKTAQVELSYFAGDLRTQFQKDTSFSTTITSLPVSLALVTPPNSVPGQGVTYTLDYRNESGQDISDLRFEFTYPDGFVFQSATPSPKEGKSIWNVAVLRKGNGGRISIQGILNGKEGEEKVVSVVVKRKIGNQYVDYERAQTPSRISNPLLGVSILINNSSDYLAHAGDYLTYTIRYANNSNFNLAGINLTMKLEGEMYDFTSLGTSEGYFDSSSGTILWNASSIPDFGNLSPNKKGEVSFKVKLKSNISSGISGSRNLFVRATARMNTLNVPSGYSGDEVFSESSLVTKISTQPSLGQLIYYNDSAFGASGPLPLEVGKETLFTIHWQIINPGNEMTGVKVSAVLPTGVVWKNVISVGSNQPEIIFNKNTSEVSWNLGTLLPGIGTSSPQYEGIFQVSVKPVENQKGQSILLIKNSRISGTDSFTKQNIVFSVRDMSTDNLTDRPEEGTVR